jgi:hypothetical protein
MSEIDVPTILTAVLTVAGVAVPALAVYLVKAKNKLTALREFIVELDDDLQDNHLSQEEYSSLVQKFKALVS